MNSEKEFRRFVIGVAEGIGGHVSHVEAHESAAGIPDLNIYLVGSDLWLELKIIKEGEIRMRPTQKRWHLDRYEHGGKSWVLVFDPRTGDVLTLPGEVAATLSPRESVWRGAASASNVNEMYKLLISLSRRMKRGHHSKHAPDSTGPQKSAGEPVRPLPASGKDVGEYHWLTNPARASGPVHGSAENRPRGRGTRA